MSTQQKQEETRSYKSALMGEAFERQQPPQPPLDNRNDSATNEDLELLCNKENEDPMYEPDEKFEVKTSVSEVVTLQFEIESKTNYPTFISAVCYPARPTISPGLPQEWAGKNLIFLKIFRSKNQSGPVIKDMGTNVKYFRLFITTDILLRIINSVPSLNASFNKNFRRLGAKDKGRTMVESVIDLNYKKDEDHTIRMFGTCEKDKMIKYYHQLSDEKYSMFILSMEALEALSRKKFDILQFNKKCSQIKTIRV